MKRERKIDINGKIKIVRKINIDGWKNIYEKKDKNLVSIICPKSKLHVTAKFIKL